MKEKPAESVEENVKTASDKDRECTKCEEGRITGVAYEAEERSGSLGTRCTEVHDTLNTSGPELAGLTAAHEKGKLKCSDHCKPKTKRA